MSPVPLGDMDDETPSNVEVIGRSVDDVVIVSRGVIKVVKMELMSELSAMEELNVISDEVSRVLDKSASDGVLLVESVAIDVELSSPDGLDDGRLELFSLEVTGELWVGDEATADVDVTEGNTDSSIDDNDGVPDDSVLLASLLLASVLLASALLASVLIVNVSAGLGSVDGASSEDIWSLLIGPSVEVDSAPVCVVNSDVVLESEFKDVNAVVLSILVDSLSLVVMSLDDSSTVDVGATISVLVLSSTLAAELVTTSIEVVVKSSPSLEVMSEVAGLIDEVEAVSSIEDEVVLVKGSWSLVRLELLILEDDDVDDPVAASTLVVLVMGKALIP